MNDVTVLSILKCPVCGKDLKRDGNALLCENKHTFDVSRSGYVNLLPPGKEKNSRTGDEKKMIRARADFLACGHYERISTCLAQFISQYRENISSICDMGSGEGYHTLNIARVLGEKTNGRLIALGADASKYGAECASKRSRMLGLMPRDGIGGDCEEKTQAYFVPANIFSMPIKDGKIDLCVSMFAPIPWDECGRVLSDEGMLAVVSSGKDHLIEMREIIYDEVKEADFSPKCDEGFEKIAEKSIKYTAHLGTKKEIEDLFTMTPFYYKTTEEGRARLLSCESLDVTVNVKYSLFAKK